MSGLEEARLNYLEKAAECLMVSSPAMSAHLQAERSTTLHYKEADNFSSSSSLLSCKACGTILINGWSCEPSKTMPRQKDGSTATRQRRNQPQTKKLSCLTCGAVTVTKTDRAARMSLNHSTTHENTSSKATGDEVPPTTVQSKQMEVKPANRRARNKKLSLKSMLTEQKHDSSKATGRFGLDLMDLMQR